MSWCSDMYKYCPGWKTLLCVLLAVGIITLYIVTIPVKEYQPHVTRKILEKKIQLPDTDSVDTESHGIPLIFHQMWPTSYVPKKYKTIRNTCLNLNKEYKSVTWTHDMMITFMAVNYPWFLDTYLNYPYQIQRVDVARYFILYHYGGVYLDMDCECKTPFKKIFSNMTKDQSVLIIETDLYGYSNGFMGAKKNDPFFFHMINRLPDFAQRYIFRHPTIILSSGPLFLTRSYNNYENQDSIYILPLVDFRKTHFYERFSGSWHGWDTEIVDLFHFHFPAILLTVVIILALVFVYKMYYHQYCVSNCGVRFGPFLKTHKRYSSSVL